MRELTRTFRAVAKVRKGQRVGARKMGREDRREVRILKRREIEKLRDQNHASKFYIRNRKTAKKRGGGLDPLCPPPPPIHPLFNLERKELVSCGSARILLCKLR